LKRPVFRQRWLPQQQQRQRRAGLGAMVFVAISALGLLPDDEEGCGGHHQRQHQEHRYELNPVE